MSVVRSAYFTTTIVKVKRKMLPYGFCGFDCMKRSEAPPNYVLHLGENN